jgi:UTP--glucose-1-phosphate uridylyltransferase
VKAVITIAGFGTRFLPASKAIPKEMFPIAGVPLIQHHIEDLVAAGITDIAVVVRDGADVIERHFSPAPDLESHLAARGQSGLLTEVQRLSDLADITMIRQPDDLPYGNASPALAARSWLGDDDFYYQFGDDIVLADDPVPRQMLASFSDHRPAALVAAQEVPEEETSLYGCLELEPGSSFRITRIVEKPPPGTAPSNLAQIGHFVFTSQVFDVLDTLDLGKQGELWLADAVDHLASRSTVIAHPIDGLWLAAGDPLRHLRADIEACLRHPEMRDDLLEFLRSLDLGS